MKEVYKGYMKGSFGGQGGFLEGLMEGEKMGHTERKALPKILRRRPKRSSQRVYGKA